MAITAKPEVLQPEVHAGSTPKRHPGMQAGSPAEAQASTQTAAARTGSAFSDENLDLLSHLLDDFIRIPGTPIRFGLDGIVGFIPGLGDVLGGLASCILLIAAWVRGVPKVVLARMLLNVAIETAVGTLPIVGDLFDIAWRANRRNYKLLEASLRQPQQHSASSWLFLAGLCVALAALMAIPFLLAGWLLVWLKHVVAR